MDMVLYTTVYQYIRYTKHTVMKQGKIGVEPVLSRTIILFLYVQISLDQKVQSTVCVSNEVLY